MNYGQFVRLFLMMQQETAPDTVIASAKTLQFHFSANIEKSTTKDTPSGSNKAWVKNEVTGYTYDITTSALVRGDDTIIDEVNGATLDGLMAKYERRAIIPWQIFNTTGENQRIKVGTTPIVAGNAQITQLTIQAPVSQVATYEAKLTGYGALSTYNS